MEPTALAVIAAMEPEASLVRRRLRQRRKTVLKVGQLWRGQAGAHRVILLRCGMGEERAAAALQWLVENERLWGVLSIGFAGGLQPDLATGDVILADQIQMWPDATVPDATVPENETSPGAFVTPNAQLASVVVKAAQEAGLPRHQGVLLSHKTLVPSALDKRVLGRYSGALAVDMESYRIGWLAAVHGLPFMSMRAILDPCDTDLDLPLDGLTTPDGGVLPAGAMMAVMRQPGLVKSFFTLWRLSRLAQHRLAVWWDHVLAMLGTVPIEEDVQRP